MDILHKISRAVAAQVPGTRINIAMKKREYERELRKQGFTWTQVLKMTAERFKKHE